MSDISWFCVIALIVTLGMLAVLAWLDRREDARFAEVGRRERVACAMRTREATRNMRKRQPIPAVKPIGGY